MSTGAGELLAEVEPLAHHGRESRLASVGDRLAGTVQLHQILADLSTMGEYERQVGLSLAIAAADRGFVNWCMDQDEPGLAHRAVATAMRRGWLGIADAQRMIDWSKSLRGMVYRWIRRLGRTDLAEVMLPMVLARHGDQEAVTLLPICGAETVAHLLPELAYTYDGWRALGHRHPDLLLDFVQEQYSRLPRGVWPMFGPRFAPGVAAAAVHRPDRALDVMESGLFDDALPDTLSRALPQLARRDANRVLRILQAPRRAWRLPRQRSFWRAMATLPDGPLQEFTRLVVASGGITGLLRQLPPHRRVLLYRWVFAASDVRTLHRAAAALDLLPAVARSLEAARLLDFHPVTDDPHLRRLVRSRLPVDVVRTELFERTGASDAGDRANGYQTLIAAAAASRDPDVLRDTLRSTTRLRNEQDPVRLAAVSALSQVPGGLFSDEVTADLSRILNDGLAAPDCSSATRRALQALIRKLLVEGAESDRPALLAFALDGIETLARYQETVVFPGLADNLRRGAEVAVLRTLLPRIEADSGRDQFGVALALAEGLGKRAWKLDALQQVVLSACHSRPDAVVRRAVGLYLADPRTRDVRVEQIWREDRSTIVIDAVAEAISVRRTDLVSAVLAEPLSGRFVKSGIRLIPTLANGFDRWTARQRAGYASMLEELAGTTSQPLHVRANAILRWGRIPGSRTNAYLDHPEVVLREAAVGSIRTGAGVAGLTDLLAWGDTDLARVALPAAARTARQIRPDRSGPILLSALGGGKVTLRKTAVQLLIDLHVPGAVDALVTAWIATGQHRDVRRAVVSGLARRLTEPAAWRVLGEAALDPATASALLSVRLDQVPDRHRAQFSSLLRTVAVSSEPEVAGQALASLPTWGRWDPAVDDLLAGEVVDLDRTANWMVAAEALVRACAWTDRGSALVRCYAQLSGSDRSEALDRDQPARQRLSVLTDRMLDRLRLDAAMSSWAGRCADELSDPTFQRLAARLRIASIDWTGDGLEDQLRRVIQRIDRAEVLVDVLPRWQADLARVVHRLREVDQAVSALADPHDARSARLAVGLLSVIGEQLGWTLPRRELLARLRRHDNVDVRSAALDVFTRPE